MPVFRWGSHWDPFRDLEREVDRLLEGVNLTLHGMRGGRRFPQVNVIEFEDRYEVVAEVPGMDLQDLEVSASSGFLTIRGVRQPPAEAREDAFRRQERFHGSWQRKLVIPDRVRDDEVRADYTAGILRITLPRAPSTVARQIPVNEGP